MDIKICTLNKKNSKPYWNEQLKSIEKKIAWKNMTESEKSPENIMGIESCKKNKTPGIDQIPDEVIKHPNITNLLFKLFDYCFKTCSVPKMWLKSTTKPKPKNSEKNPFYP